MNFKTTLILLIVLVAVVAWLAVDRYTSTPGPATQANASGAQSSGKPLFSIKPEDVEKVSIQPAMGKKIVMEQTAGKWRLSEPVSAAAESWQVDSLVREITGLQTRGKIAAGIDTGLTHPRYRVELTTREGKTVQLSVGDKTAIGDAMYVRVGDQNGAQIVPSDAWTELSRPVNDYRDKGLVDITSQQIKQLSIERPGEPKIVLVKEGTEWKMAAPQAMPVDQNAATDLLFAVTGAQVSRYVPPGQARTALTRLDEPQLTVWYSTEPPSTQPATQSSTRPSGTDIEFGGYDSVLKEHVFATVGRSGEVVTLPASTLASFKKTPLDLRDKKVLDLAPEKVRKVTLTIDRAATTKPTTRPASQEKIVLDRREETPAAAGPVLAASRPTTQLAGTRPTTEPTAKPEASKWVVSGTHKGDADDANVAALLNDLHPLTAVRFITQPPTTRPMKRYTLVVQTDDGATHTLDLFDEGSGGKLIGSMGDLRFELNRSLVDAMDAKLLK